MRLWYFSHDESAVKRVPIAVYVNTHSKVAIGTTALGQGLANVVHEVLLAAGRGADGLLLEFDLRHDGRSRVAQLAQWTGGVIRSRSRRGELRSASRWQGGERMRCRSSAFATTLGVYAVPSDEARAETGPTENGSLHVYQRNVILDHTVVLKVLYS
jgi:hypothetical protein